MNKTTEALTMAIEAFRNIGIKNELLQPALDACKEALKSQEQEPNFFGWYDNHDIHYEKQTDDSIPLYTNPAQPLSDDVVDTASRRRGNNPAFVEGVRWAEQAHGIGVKDA